MLSTVPHSFKTAMCSAVAWVEGRVLLSLTVSISQEGKEEGVGSAVGWHICQIDGAWKKEEEGRVGTTKKGGGSWFGVVKNGLVHLGPVWKEGYLRCRAVGLVSREQESFIECSKGVTRSVLNFPFLQKKFFFQFFMFTKKEKVSDLKFAWPLETSMKLTLVQVLGVNYLNDFWCCLVTR